MRRLVLVSGLSACLALVSPLPVAALEPATPTVGTSPAPCPPPAGGLSTDGPSPRRIVAGDLVTLTTTITGPLDNVALGLGNSYRWLTPTSRGPAQLAEEGSGWTFDVPAGESVTRSWSGRPTTSTRVVQSFGYRTGCLFAAGWFALPGAGVIDVAPRLTLTAVRTGVREYVFSGTASRPGQVLSLYRRAPGGREVLTAQTRAADDGTWTIARRFGTSGRYDVVLRTGRDMANAPGASSVRPTVVH